MKCFFIYKIQVSEFLVTNILGSGSWSSTIDWQWWKADKLKEEADSAIQLKEMAYKHCMHIVYGAGL